MMTSSDLLQARTMMCSWFRPAKLLAFHPSPLPDLTPHERAEARREAWDDFMRQEAKREAYNARREAAMEEAAMQEEEDVVHEDPVQSPPQSRSSLLNCVGSVSRYSPPDKWKAPVFHQGAESDYGGGGCLPPYDPSFVSSMSPRWRFRFYYHSLRAERLRRELEEEINRADLEEEALLNERRCARKIDVEEGTAQRSSFQEEKDKCMKKMNDKRSGWRPISPLKSLLILGVLFLAIFCLAYICSSSSVAFQSNGAESVIEISISLPHLSRFSFGKLMINRLPNTSFHMLTRSSRLPNCSIHMTGCECGDPCTPT